MQKPPSLRVTLRAGKVRAHYESVLRLVAEAKACGHPVRCKASCDTPDLAQEWEELWSHHGVICERLLANNRYFELTREQVHRLPGLPSPRSAQSMVRLEMPN